jgi:methylphosphotriester-DNA--protein-cysteine methyltransferase
VSRYDPTESLGSKQEAVRQRARPIPQAKPEYTVNEAAEIMGISRWTATRVFENEPGVRIYGNEKSTRNRRRRRMLRIPEYVLRRVQERHTVR